MKAFGAIVRHRWPVAAVVGLALAAGALATQFVEPEYQASAIIQLGAPRVDANGRWLETSRMVDTVVQRLALYARPNESADTALLANLSVGRMFMPGAYHIAVDDGGEHWQLWADDNMTTDSGAAGDSIGKDRGLLWRPEPAALAKLAGREAGFAIVTPREAAAELSKRLSVVQIPDSNAIRLTLTDSDPQRAARALNAIAGEYVAAARAARHADATLHDSAIAPLAPRNAAPRVLGVAFLVGVVASIGLVLVLNAIAS